MSSCGLLRRYLCEYLGRGGVGLFQDLRSVGVRQGFKPCLAVKAPGLRELTLRSSDIRHRHDKLAAVANGDRHREHQARIGRPGRDDDRHRVIIPRRFNANDDCGLSRIEIDAEPKPNFSGEGDDINNKGVSSNPDESQLAGGGILGVVADNGVSEGCDHVFRFRETVRVQQQAPCGRA